MTLNKRQRLAAYKDVLKRIEQDRYTMGLCIYLKQYMIRKYTYWCSCAGLLDIFPEFAKRRPKNLRNFFYWWKEGSTAPRIRAMKKCIEETSPKKK